MARRNNVVTSKIAGKEENMRGRSIYREVKSTMSETIILSAIQTSSTAVGRGKISIARMNTRESGIRRLFSPLFPSIMLPATAPAIYLRP
jgi:hypothetical protein